MSAKIDLREPQIATVGMLRRAYKNRKFSYFAFSPYTGEQISADPRDYFRLEDDEVLVDSENNVMYLCKQETIITAVSREEIEND